MRVRLIETLVASFAIAIPVAGWAQSVLDAPHDPSFNDGGCNNCHGLYQPTDSGRMDYNPGCNGCHNGTLATTSFGLPWPDTAQAVPGQGGYSHSWTAHGDNAKAGAKIPTSAGIQKYMLDGKLQCITCHNLHANKTASAPSSMHTSFAIDAAMPETGSTNPTPGSATLTLKAASTTPKGYRINILSNTGGGGTFAISHDFGVTATYSAPYTYTNNVQIALDDPGVKIQISAGAAVGDHWDFYISHPMLRLTNVTDAGCVICHSQRDMNHVRARGNDSGYAPDGVRQFSHPVGVALNTAGYTDRTTIRDANGAAQGTDGIKSNDLALDAGVVRCTTCHAVHNADSNSLTEDAR